MSGFAIIEVVIASALLLLSVVAVGSQLGTQFMTITTSANQQAAEGLMNQAMEQVRALPYTFVATGLSTTDSTVTSDPNIVVAGSTCKTNNSAIWNPAEVIPCGPNNPTQAPFVPHISTSSVDGTTFTIAAYPSIDAADTGSGPYVYRVTVVVHWSSPKPGPKQVVAQTLVFSAATGCITQTNHPFAAPCQPFLYSSAAFGGGSVTVTPDSSSGTTGIAGDSFNSVQLLLAQLSSNTEIEQVSTVLGSVSTSGAAVKVNGDTTTSAGVSASLSADNDPGTARSPTAPAAVSQSATALQAAGSGANANWLSVVPGSGDSGNTVTTATASASPACYDLLGVTQLMGLPCGSGQVSQSGSDATLQMGLFAGGTSLGAAPLADVAAQLAAYPDKTFVGRYTASGGSYCSTTTGDGCVHAGAQGALGTVQLAGLPPQFVSDNALPASWGSASGNCPAGNYFVAVVNFSARASSESGVNPASPTVVEPIPGAPTPYLCYWTASGYQSVPITWGSAAPAISFPTVSVSDPSISPAVSVSITPSLQLAPTSTSTSLPAGCSTVCKASATVPSPLQGDIVYVVTQGSSVIADVDVHVNLGELIASTSYQAAP